MRLTIFSRLVFGYLAILTLMVAVSLYGIFQLRRFSDVTRSVLEVDNPMTELVRNITDTLFSQVRYERKYVISKDDTLFDQFLLFQSDFDQYLEEAMALAGPQAKALLKNAQEEQLRYQKIFYDEVGRVKAGQAYPQSEVQREKEKVLETVTAHLEQLRSSIQQASASKVRDLAEAGANAGRVALLIMGIAFFSVVVISFWITRSITGPMAALERKTREIAKGNFEGELKLSSPPEIAALAGALNSMSEKLKDLDKMKSDFFSSMSHELRTPLTSIKEGTGLLLDGVGGPLTEKQKRLLGILAEESGRLIDMVNSLLDLTKMEAGMMTYSFELGSLAPLIQRASVEMGPLVEAKKIRLQTRVSGDLPIVKVDSERMLQAIRNLIGNAVKFTPEGGQVTVWARSTDGKLEVSVADTGPGIAPEHLPTIFEKYQQASHGGTDGIRGTGLGLAIVRHIITSHGGEIWVESDPGKGSTFTFLLPA